MFKSLWEECPTGWTQPQLAKQFQLLRSIIPIANRALEKARLAKKIHSSLEAEVTIHTSSDMVKSTLQELTEPCPVNGMEEVSLSDYLIVSRATVQDGVLDVASLNGLFSDEGAVDWSGEQELVRVVAMPFSESGHVKCPRCWKWTRVENEELCGRCRHVELRN